MDSGVRGLFPRLAVLVVAVTVAGLLCAPSYTVAQEETPRLGYVYPAGGQQRTTFQVWLGGQHLDGANMARISGGGVQARVIDHIRPLNQGAFKTVQKQMQDLADKKQAAAPDGWRGGRRGSSQTFTNIAWTAEDEKRLNDLRARMTTFYIRPSSVPALVESVLLEVSVAPDASPGRRELRLQTDLGLTNPLAFEIGQLSEYTEQSERSRVVAESINGTRRRRPPPNVEKPAPGTTPLTNAPKTVVAITLPSTLNGQILPGDADRYRFRARKGQQLVVAVNARSLIPYLSDTVPGWFQAVVTLFDADGKEMAYDDHFRFNPDPVLHCTIPRDGDYALEIRDSLYRGREDFVYRVDIGELPYVTGIFPMGGRSGTKTTLQLTGWNLPATNLTSAAQAPGVHPVCVRNGECLSNRMPFAVDTLPECLEVEPNNSSATAQRVTLPGIVNGRIDRSDDLDVFCFEGRAGQRVVGEAKARRLDSPLDSALKLTDAAGRQLALNDDYEDKGAGLTTHHADSRLGVTLPADGRYYLYLLSQQQKGGADCAYRLHLHEPQPDFELRVVPSSINARAGTTVPITVHVLRRDDFAGEITLALQDAPPGFKLGGARVPAGQEMVKMTLAVPAEAPAPPLGLRVIGRANILQREVIHQAVSADDVVQAFTYRHLVPAEDLEVCVMGPPQSFAVGPLGTESIKIPLGGHARLPVNIPSSTSWGPVELELIDPPAGITIGSVALGRRDGGIVFRSDGQTAKAGLNGNLIVKAVAVRDPATMMGREQRKKPRRLLTALPAIPFEIVVANPLKKR